jgi:hypothetical protein
VVVSSGSNVDLHLMSWSCLSPESSSEAVYRVYLTSWWRCTL